jgi:photosystem II stability/assembly factor-like uncharacterized protein
VALTAFVVVDVVLVVLVLQHVNRTPPGSDLGPAASLPSPTPERETNQQAFDFKPARAATLDLANDGTWVFATRGSCTGRSTATVLTSTDAGASPTRRDPGLRTVTAVQADDGGRLVVVGAGPDCQPRQRSSVDGGATWVDDPAITRWYTSPSDPRTAVSPSQGGSKPGCTFSSLSQVDDDFARVTCIDGDVVGSGDGGRTWVLLGRLDNTRTAVFTTFNAGYALARFEGCAAQVFSTKDSGRTWAPGSCIVGDPARAIAANDTTVAAVVGEEPEAYVSTDQGQEFGQP